ncbi:MAG: choice-of-anchor S family protein [Candidatus Heimdallarchaeota archaeon]
MLKIGLLYLTIVLILSSTMVRGEYNVIAGQATDYVVTTSNWTVAVGTNSGGGTGFNLEDKNYTEGSNLNIEVTSTSPTTIYYNLTVDGDEYTSSSNPLGNLFFLLGSMFLPVMMSEMIGSTWDQAEIDMGPGLWGDFFMDTSFTSLCYMLANNQTLLDELFNTNLPINDGLTFNKIDAAFDNNTDIAIFDYALDIEWVNSTTNTDYSGIYRWKIAFDQTTGWVKGWRLFMDYSGIIEGTLFDIKWNQLVHQSGYILGDFAIGTNQFPGFEWFLIIPALGLLAIPVINKRRK